MRDLILYVDDEEQSLKYFSLAFGSQYEVLTAANAEQAWAVVERECDRLAMVISDQRMPGRSGVELLTSIKERCPRAVRLLATAYTDLSSAIDAVNQGAIFAYISKPWKIDELRMVIRQALALHHLQVERDALLAEKISVFQQLLLADRKRAFGLSAAALTGQVRRPLAAATSWARDRDAHFAITNGGVGDARDLWSTVIDQSRRSVALAQDIGRWLAINRTADESIVDLVALLDAASRTSGVKTTPVKTDAAMPVDRTLLTAGWADLLGLMARIKGGAGRELSIDVHLAAGPVIFTARIEGAGQPAAEGEDDGDRLGFAAYLAIHHHGGTITVTRWDRSRGHLTIRLGAVPSAVDDGFESFLAELHLTER
jgi:FixJ family two-component response regulator